MKFFRKPVTAIILAFLIVAGSTLINVHWKFGAICREIQDSFYETGRIGKQLEAIRQDAVLLSSVAKQNGIDAEDLRYAADDLQSALSRESTGAGLLFWYYDTLRTELISTEQRLLSSASTVTLPCALPRCRSARTRRLLPLRLQARTYTMCTSLRTSPFYMQVRFQRA